MDGDLHEGGGLCGRVRYRMAGEPLSSNVCHCVSRRAAGAQSVAWLTVSDEGFSFVSGEPAEHRSSPEVTRAFCGGCGTSPTYRQDDAPDTVDVIAAGLGRPEAFLPACRV